MRFLPRQQEVSGWIFENDPLVIPPANLRERIGYDAEHFLRYEVVDLTIGEYRRSDGPGFAIVEIFRFPDFIKAFGAYSTRRAPVGPHLQVENEGYAGPRSVHVWRGPFYVRVIGGGTPEAREKLIALATACITEMPPAPGKPAVFQFFPEANRLPHSETFNARDAFGQPLLRNSFTAEFAIGNERVTGLILPANSREAAAGIVANYRNFFVANGRLLDPVANLGEANFTAEDRHFGRTVAFRIDRFVIAFRGFVPPTTLLNIAIATDQRILSSIRTQLQQDQRAAQLAAAAARATAPPPRPAGTATPAPDQPAEETPPAGATEQPD